MVIDDIPGQATFITHFFGMVPTLNKNEEPSAGGILYAFV